MLHKGNMGYLKNFTDRAHTGLGNNNYSPLLWKELGPQNLKPRSPKAPVPSHYQLCHFLVLEKQLLFLSIHQGLREKSPKGPGPRLLLAGPSTVLVLKRSCVPFSCYQGLWESLSSSAQLQYKHICKAIQPSLPSILRTQSLSLKTCITRNPTFSTLPSPWQVAFYFLTK